MQNAQWWISLKIQSVKLPLILFSLLLREIANPDEIEPEMLWVFDYEYIKPDVEVPDAVKFQYVRSDDAQVYLSDKQRLDKYIQGYGIPFSAQS